MSVPAHNNPAKQTYTTQHGWLVLDKPLGLTSTQALGKARRLVGGKKAGHGGTLDPLATGILPLAFGEATKLIPYVMDGVKQYEFTIRWGEQRSTDDAEGEVIATSAHRPDAAAIKSALPAFTGVIQQTPPAFSAIKLDGIRAYDIARAGGTPEMVSREVLIENLELVSVSDDGNEAMLRVTSGKGMYVRSLARDLALLLGTFGYVSQLRRTRVGGFTLDQAVTLDHLEQVGAAALQPLQNALAGFAILMLTASEAQTLRSGQSLLIRPQHMALMQQPVILAMHQNVPVALVEARFGAFHVLRGFSFG